MSSGFCSQLWPICDRRKVPHPSLPASQLLAARMYLEHELFGSEDCLLLDICTMLGTSRPLFLFSHPQSYSQFTLSVTQTQLWMTNEAKMVPCFKKTNLLAGSMSFSITHFFNNPQGGQSLEKPAWQTRGDTTCPMLTLQSHTFWWGLRSRVLTALLGCPPWPLYCSTACILLYQNTWKRHFITVETKGKYTTKIHLTYETQSLVKYFL